MTLEDFFPFVLPSAKGVPEPVAAFHIRNAIIELCEKAPGAWVEEQPPVVTIAGLQTYDYNVAPGQRIVKLLSLKVAGLKLDVVAPGDGQNMLDAGSTRCFAFGLNSGFTINPTVADDLIITTNCAVCPSLDAEIVSDDMVRFTRRIAHGALAELLAIPDRDWTNPGAAGVNSTKWLQDLADTRSDILRGFSRSRPRTRANFF